MGPRRMAFLICAIALLCSIAFGQATGTLSGTILDPGGAAVPNVKVEVKNLTTGATFQTISGPEGIFVFNSLYPANYDLTINATGFKAYSQKGIALTAAEKRNLGNLSLVLGAVTEEVSVTAIATPVQTASSEKSQLIEATQMANITMKGRDLFGILQTIPGISFGNALLSGTNGDATSNAGSTFGQMSINGGGTARSAFTVDGVIAMDNGNNSQLMFEPTTDSIAEIRVLTSNYQAEYGHSSGGQISVITKGGSQEFHGSINVNKRHEMWNAHTWNQGWQNQRDKSKYRFFITTYTVGGPLYIPKLFNTQKKKLFFFWSQEYTRQKPSSSTTQTAMVPTQAQLNGNFFDRCTITGATLDPVYNIPTTCTPAYVNGSGTAMNGPASGFLIDPSIAGRTTPVPGGDLSSLVGKNVAGGTVAIIDPASQAMGQAFLKSLPLPNMCTPSAGYTGSVAAGTAKAIGPENCPAGYLKDLPYAQNPGWRYGANYMWGYTNSHPRRNDTARLDWAITSRLNSYVRWTRDHDLSNQNYSLPIRGADGSYNPYSLDFALPGHGVAVGATYTISPTMVNEFTFGKIWNGVGWYPHDATQPLASNITSTPIPGFNDLTKDPNVTGPGNHGPLWNGGTGYMNWAPLVPSITFGSGFGNTTAANGRNESNPNTSCGWGTCPYTNWAESYTFSDSISKVQGKHNLKFGVYVERTAKDQQGGQGTYVGSWNFTSNGANPFDTGDGFANAWLGDFNNFQQGTRNFSEWWFWQTEFFVQDSWRVSRRLTLDLGARFYAMPPITNTSTGVNASSEFVPGAYNKAAQMRIYEQACVYVPTMTYYATTTTSCPSNANYTQMAWDRKTGSFAPVRLAGTFVPASVGGYTVANPSPTSGLVRADGTNPLLPQGMYTVPTVSPAFRFGFAWDVFGDGKTAIRGGVGQFLNRLSYNQIAGANSYSVPPPATTYFGHIMDVNDPAVKAAGIMSPIGTAVGFLGKQQNESTYNGSFGIQQNIGFSTVVDASWVFNLRRHIPYTMNRNYFPLWSQYENAAAWVDPLNAYRQNPTVTGYPTIANNGMALTGNNYIYQMDNVCPTCVAGYSGIAMNAFEESAHYHALQISVRRNMTKHLSFGVAFNWNKYMAGAFGTLFNNDPGIARSPIFPTEFRNYGPSYQPTPQSATFNFVYEPPNVAQKLDMGFASKVMGVVTDHWTISALGQWRSNSMASIPGVNFSNQTGTCSNGYNPPAGTWGNCYPGWNWTGSSEGARANVVGDYKLSSLGKTWAYNPAYTADSTHSIPLPANANPTLAGQGSSYAYDPFSTGENWVMNPAAFAASMPCSKGAKGALGISNITGQPDPHYGIGEDLACFGNAGPGSLLNIPGTRVNNWDLTMSKNFPLKNERRYLTFRMEMYNVLNHPNFTGGASANTWDWRNWLQGRYINTNAGINRLGGTLNQRQMSMTLRLTF